MLEEDGTEVDDEEYFQVSIQFSQHCVNLGQVFDPKLDNWSDP